MLQIGKCTACSRFHSLQCNWAKSASKTCIKINNEIHANPCRCLLHCLIFMQCIHARVHSVASDFFCSHRNGACKKTPCVCPQNYPIAVNRSDFLQQSCGVCTSVYSFLFIFKPECRGHGKGRAKKSGLIKHSNRCRGVKPFTRGVITNMRRSERNGINQNGNFYNLYKCLLYKEPLPYQCHGSITK